MRSTDTLASPDGTCEAVASPHIVVVNDTQEILELFREILEDEGYRVSLYSFAFNDLDTLIALEPDLVVLDFMIGGESHGWQLLQKMKMDRRTATIPVIVCSAALRLLQELEGHLSTKNVGIVLKPFDIDDLVVEVRRHLTADPPESVEDPHPAPKPKSPHIE